MHAQNKQEAEDMFTTCQKNVLQAIYDQIKLILRENQRNNEFNLSKQ